MPLQARLMETKSSMYIIRKYKPLLNQKKEDSDKTDSADTATQTNVGLMASSMIAAGSALCLLIIKRFYKKR